jgi:hypothetical protein
VLPINILRKVSGPSIDYILARKLFRRKKYKPIIELLSKRIEDSHPVRPFSLMLKASVYSLMRRSREAIEVFRECIDVSNDNIKSVQDKTRKRQLEVNRDYCAVGIARTNFSNKKNQKAYSDYLDVSKDSYIWPEIIFEEAWNSFYLRDYNRTLGKLVTYKAPVFSSIFNPEIEVLKSLTYMEMCLWNDARVAVDNFYKKYGDDLNQMRTFAGKRDYKWYYKLAKKKINGKSLRSRILNRIMQAIIRDPTFQELYSRFTRATSELGLIRKVSHKKFRNFLMRGFKNAMVLQRDLIGGYVRKRNKDYTRQTEKALKGMSYIKLEILSRKKKELYSFSYLDEKRGDIKYLKRNDKQYFWSFNGEFWADELGDYVFALKSGCRWK